LLVLLRRPLSHLGSSLLSGVVAHLLDLTAHPAPERSRRVVMWVVVCVGDCGGGCGGDRLERVGRAREELKLEGGNRDAVQGVIPSDVWASRRHLSRGRTGERRWRRRASAPMMDTHLGDGEPSKCDGEELLALGVDGGGVLEDILGVFGVGPASRFEVVLVNRLIGRVGLCGGWRTRGAFGAVPRSNCRACRQMRGPKSVL